jgi:predicted acylesterase/phospholipase RssA
VSNRAIVVFTLDRQPNLKLQARVRLVCRFAQNYPVSIDQPVSYVDLDSPQLQTANRAVKVALVPDRGLRRLLRQHLRLERLDEAPITLHVVATDVLTDAEVQLSQGNAKDAIMASAAIPGIFPPVRIGARPLMDSSVAENTPIGHAVALGATTMWVRPSGRACSIEKAPGSAFGIALSRVDLKVLAPLCPLAISPSN